MDENPHGLLIDPPLELRPFVAGGRITAMSAKRTRRRLLLDRRLLAGRRHCQLALSLAPSAGGAPVSAKPPENQAQIL